MTLHQAFLEEIKRGAKKNGSKDFHTSGSFIAKSETGQNLLGTRAGTIDRGAKTIF